MTTIYDANFAARLLEVHLAPIIGKKLAKRVAKSAHDPTSEFIETVIRPQLFNGLTYTPVSDTQKTPGRNHDFAEAIATDQTIAEQYGVDPLQTMTFFTNVLRVAVEPEEIDGTVERPKDRVVFARYATFTFEFDHPCVDFLQHQFGWTAYTKNQLDCPIGRFYLECSRSSDFAGITVVYAGNKSLHIHVVFETAQVDALASISARTAQEVRRGLITHWHRLKADLMRVVETDGHSPDPSLSFPEQYRRIPNGIRVAEGGNLPGFAVDAVVPQVVVWEKFRQRASGDNLPLFFNPDLFAEEPETHSAKPGRSRPSRIGPMTIEQHAHCANWLKTRYPDYPRFHSLNYEGGRWLARFYNSATDRTPSSIMREDYQTIRALGTDGDQVDAKPLPAPLADMLRLLCEQMPGGSCASIDDVDLDKTGRLIRTLETRFRANVIDKSSAHAEMRAFFTATVSNLALLMVVGPEGVGKTTTLFEQHCLSARRLLLKGESARSMFAFAEYKDAQDKCAKFNELQAGNGFIGVVLPSFTRAYEEARDELGLDEITRLSAIRDGYRSHFDAIRRLQPKVIEVFRKRHDAIWQAIGNKTPVFFAVHQTMHRWRESSLTRLMWAPSFWSTMNDEDQKGRVTKLRAETTLGIAVHDEVKIEHVVRQWPAELVKWVNKLRFSEAAWTAEHRDLTECLTSFEHFQLAHGNPIIRGKARPITFDEVLEIERWNAMEPDEVIARDSGEYQIKALARRDDGEEQVNVYEAVHGAQWRVSERDWWDGLAHQVILLTTESVPTALVRATTSPWCIAELTAPLIPKHVVQVHAQRSLTGKNLPVICADFRELHPDTYIISNKAKPVPDTMPHVTARGSNKLIGKHIMQTMTHMTPEQYEELQVLNAWTGRSDLVGLSHIDEFNQSAGRNLGFRCKEGVTHTLLIHRRLFRVLVSSKVIGLVRYSWEPVLNKDQRTILTKGSDPTDQ